MKNTTRKNIHYNTSPQAEDRNTSKKSDSSYKVISLTQQYTDKTNVIQAAITVVTDTTVLMTSGVTRGGVKQGYLGPSREHTAMLPVVLSLSNAPQHQCPLGLTHPRGRLMVPVHPAWGIYSPIVVNLPKKGPMPTPKCKKIFLF